MTKRQASFCFSSSVRVIYFDAALWPNESWFSEYLFLYYSICMNFRFLWGWQYLLFPTFKLVIWWKCTMTDVSALVGAAPFGVSPQKPSVNWWAYRHVVWVVRNSLSCPSAKTECVFISIRVLCWLNLWPWIRLTHRSSSWLWPTGVVPSTAADTAFLRS